MTDWNSGVDNSGTRTIPDIRGWDFRFLFGRLLCVWLQRLGGSLSLFWQKRAPAKALSERFGVDAERRSDPDGGDDAGVDVSVDARPAEAEEPSYLGNRERPLDPLDLLGKGNGWVT